MISLPCLYITQLGENKKSRYRGGYQKYGWSSGRGEGWRSMGGKGRVTGEVAATAGENQA